MLERLAGNTALKADLAAALAADRLPHALLLVGAAGSGTGFAARCLAADYLYPAGGPHAEAVLKGEDSECIALRGEGPSGQIKVERIRAARAAIGRTALSQDARGRVFLLYGAQDLNASSANALLKILEEPPDGVLFLLTAPSAAAVLPTIRSRCAAYTLAPLDTDTCARALRAARPALARDPARAQALAVLYGGLLGAALRTQDDPARARALDTARALCGYAQQGDAYRVQAALVKLERDRPAAAALLEQLRLVCSAALRAPDPALPPARAACISEAARQAQQALDANANLRLTLTTLGLRMLR